MPRTFSYLLVLLLILSAGVSLHAATIVSAGTPIPVMLDQSVSSKDARAGQPIAGSIARDIRVDGKTLIPKGSRVKLSVASVEASGRLQTPAKLWLKIDSIEVNGRTFTPSARWSGQQGPSHAKRNAVAIGGGAVAGALIGGIAGGGKGAAIGAGAGAGAGTAGAAATGKKDIEFPAESTRTFTLKADLVIN